MEACCIMVRRHRRRSAAPERLKELLRKAKSVQMTPSERETQRRSFAYGNTKIEYEDITRETIDRESEAMTDGNAEQDRNRTRE